MGFKEYLCERFFETIYRSNPYFYRENKCHKILKYGVFYFRSKLRFGFIPAINKKYDKAQNTSKAPAK